MGRHDWAPPKGNGLATSDARSRRSRSGVLAAAVCVLLVAACGGPAAPGAKGTAYPAPTHTSSPTAAAFSLDHYAGVYRTAAGVTYLLTRSHLLVDTADSSVHAVDLADPGVVAVGPSFGETRPQAATITFSESHTAGSLPDGLLLRWTSGVSVAATRVVTTVEDVRITSGDVQLAATITRPAGVGRLPAIAIVHGSGRETRSMLDLWTQLYVSLGLTVLAYDKRGVGDSTGHFPGENSTDTTLHVLAGDAAAVVTYLRARPDVDPSRVGLYGGSQGGWVVPIADTQVSPAFSIIASGPPLTTGQQDIWSELTSNGNRVPAQPDAQIDATLGAEHGGYDPMPILARDVTPTLWLFGAVDLHVPTRVAVANLTSLHRRNFAWHVFSRCDHNLLDTGTGVDSDDATATAFGAGLFGAIGDYVQRHAVHPG